MKSIFSAALLIAVGFAIKINQPSDDDIAQLEAELDQAKKDGKTQDEMWDDAIDNYCEYNNCDELDSQDQELILKHLEKVAGGSQSDDSEDDSEDDENKLAQCASQCPECGGTCNESKAEKKLAQCGSACSAQCGGTCSAECGGTCNE